MEVRLNGKAVPVRQLTVGEVNEFLEAKPEPPSTADLLVNRDIPELVVRMATGLTAEELNGDALPSELAAVWDAVREVNPFLEDLLLRLNSAGREIIAEQDGEQTAAGSEK